MNTIKCLLGLTLLISLSACKSETPALSTRTPVPLTATENPAPTPVSTSLLLTTPTATATSLPVPTQFNTPTVISPQAKTPAFTPTSVPVTTPTLSILPDWITAPTANILLLRNAKDSAITLYNADSGKQREIYTDIDDPQPGWVWQENRYLLSFEILKPRQKVIDIVTGDKDKIPRFNPDAFSPDGRYEILITRQEDKSELVAIVDHEKRIKTELFNPFRNFQTLAENFTESATAFWSPDGTLLSVMYTKWYSSGNSDYNLIIYTPSGEIFRQYQNIHLSWQNPWNPVLPYRILYTSNNSNLPCILKVTENTKMCLKEINEWAGSQNVVLFNYLWSPAGNRISYVYGGSDLPNTGLCYIELTTKDIVCPVAADDLQLEEQLFARIQFWSPDGRYLALFFDEYGFMDVIGDTNVAVFDIDNQTFQVLPGKYLWPSGNPWRPPIP